MRVAYERVIIKEMIFSPKLWFQCGVSGMTRSFSFYLEVLTTCLTQIFLLPVLQDPLTVFLCDKIVLLYINGFSMLGLYNSLARDY